MIKLSINGLKCTFKIVQSRALANRSFYVIKLVVRPCVDVLRLVSCYNTENTHIQEKKYKMSFI